MQCRTCDTVNDRDARFCRVCGTAFASPAPTNAAASHSTIGAASDRDCAACGKPNPAGARFCVYCAAALHMPVTSQTVALRPAMAGVATYTAPQPTWFTVANPGNVLLRAIWFALVGWWLGLVWTIVAWLFNLSLIGLPIGVLMLNAIPQVMTLRPRTAVRGGVGSNGNVVVQRPPTQPFAVRALWFVFIGWWASLLWMITAWSLSASIVLLPIGFWMFNRVPTITTLAAE